MKRALYFLFLFHTLASSIRANPLSSFFSALENQDKAPLALEHLKSGFIFLSFIFTRCPMPEMCPLTLQKNKELLSKWIELPEQNKKNSLRFVLITLDPEFDRPEVLKRYAKANDLDLNYFDLATGRPAQIETLAAQFNVVGLVGSNSFSHNVRSVLLKPNFTFVSNFDNNDWDPVQILRAIKN